MMRLLFIGLIFAVACSSCDSKKQQSNYSGQGEVDYILQDSLTVRMSDMIDSVRYIKLETSEHCLLDRISDLKFYDRKLFIQDRNEDLYVFADDGRFLNKIGVRGRGPEEYSGINNFFLDKTNKWVGIITYGYPTIVFYDFKGNFVKNISGADISFRSFIMKGTIYNRSLFLYIDSYYPMCSVQICDQETMNSRIALNPYPLKGQQVTRWSSYPFAETAAGITFIKPYSDTLFRFDGTSVKPRFIYEHSTPLASQQVFDTYHEKKGKTDPYSVKEYLAKHNYFQGIMGVLETSDYLFMMYNGGSCMWNKNLKKGGSEGIAYVYEEGEIYRPPLTDITSSTDECFIAVVGYSGINSLNNYAKRGCRLDPGMKQILTEWNEDDNPVVALYYMKKEI